MNRRMTGHWFLGLLGASAPVLVSALLFGSSCDDTASFGLKPDAGGGGVGGVGSTSSSGEGGFNVSDAGCDNACSNDLKRVVDCYGKTLQECPPDQGCSGAQCINDPCAAALESKSSYGCDYWAVKTGLPDAALGACFTAFVANTWSTAVKITVEYDNQKLPVGTFAYIPKGQGSSLTYDAYDEAVGLPEGKVAVLFLARNQNGFVPDCPKEAAVKTEAGVPGTGRGKAFHITTDRPVVAYQLLPYGGGSSAFTSATLLLPTSAWGTNYIAVNAYSEGNSQQPAGSPLIDILAYKDNTTVTILPNADIVGGPGVSPATKNVPTQYTLNAGEFIQINQPAELSGSVIASDEAVGLWGGSTCLYLPKDKPACDSAQQQIPPVSALGSEYAAVRYRGRNGQDDEVVPWRIVGAMAGTELTWEPDAPPNAPKSITQGGVYEFESAGPFVVRSQDGAHPFYLAGYMTGGSAFNNEGDPEWVNVVPTAQYLDHYVMFADPTYSETNLVVVRTKAKGGKEFADVTLDCAGTLGDWQPLGNYEWTRVNLVTGNFADVGNCSNGGHVLSSSLPFGVTVWGWGSKAASPATTLVSYAYPAGAGFHQINNIVVPTDPK